ncbi:hypothetical protein N431DRAFT_442965 [Stipitochalara longipes BDJ]|nr:hypothetical protein N431DRAFT_442965 [Stipitochalara longipes BDJ]
MVEVNRLKLPSVPAQHCSVCWTRYQRHFVSRYLERLDQSRQGLLDKFVMPSPLVSVNIIAGLGQGILEQVQCAMPKAFANIPGLREGSPMSELDVSLQPISPKTILTSPVPLRPSADMGRMLWGCPAHEGGVKWG